MDFNGTFELEETTVDEVWLALSDPVLVRNALPGCEFLVPVEDENPDFDALHEEAADRDEEPTADPETIMDRAFEEDGRYAAVMGISVGPVNPTFETVVLIDTREYPSMRASGEGSAGNSSFEMTSGMELTETDDGVAVEWDADADIFGKIASMGQRVVNPVANKVVQRFFSAIQEELSEQTIASDADLDELTDSGDASDTSGDTT
jgi:carbon monoxide dehydrogenase subunit G